MSNCPRRQKKTIQVPELDNQTPKLEDENDLSGLSGGVLHANPREMESGVNMLGPDHKQTDYYQILGVAEDATIEEIKKKWLKLSLIHHPDKEGGDEKMFAKINEAYKVLSNPETRKKFNDSIAKTYDQLRDTEHRDTLYHVNQEFVIHTDDRVEFNRDKFMETFDQSRSKFDDLNQIKVVNEKEAKQMPKKSIEEIMAERNRELDGFLSVQKSDLFDPRKNMDEFNHVFTQFHKMNQRTDLQAVDDFLLDEQHQMGSSLAYASYQMNQTENGSSHEMTLEDRRQVLDSLINETKLKPTEIVHHRLAQVPAKLSDLEARMKEYQDQTRSLNPVKEAEESKNFFENNLDNADKLTRQEVDNLVDDDEEFTSSDSEIQEL